MKAPRPALLLLAIQLALVLSIAGKYLYERHTRPRVWARTTQADPNRPLRGRYLALRLLVDACALPRDPAHFTPGYPVPGTYRSVPTFPGTWRWDTNLTSISGRLAATLIEHPTSPRDTAQITLRADLPCERATVSDPEEFFIPDRAQTPFPLKPGQELWVEVTLPPTGPPRPIQLALSTPQAFHPLNFE